MDQQKRLLLVVGLCMAMTIAYSKLVMEPQENERRAKADAEFAALVADGGILADGGLPVRAVEAPPVVPVAADLDGGTDSIAAAPPVLPKRELTLNRETTHFNLSTEGGGMTHAVLQGVKEREQGQVSISEGFGKLFGKKMEPPPQMDLAQVSASSPLPFSLSVTGGSYVAPTARAEVVEESEGKVVFKTMAKDLELTRTFTWPKAGYEYGVRVDLKNTGAQPMEIELGVHNVRQIDPTMEHESSMFGGIGNESAVICRIAGETHRVMPTPTPGPLSCGSSGDKAPQEFKGLISFAGIDQQYFLSALFPANTAREGRCVLHATRTLRTADTFFKIQIAPGEVQSVPLFAYLGPKDLELLGTIKGASVSPSGTVIAGEHPGLESTVDFGWWAVICKVLLAVLKFFHGLAGNWGFAIILLTISVKIILLPLTHKAMVSAEGMKKLQPKIEEMKKKFPDDKERQQVEQMKIFSEAKVSPFGGCLPLVIQVPIWAALFTTLRTSYELYGEPFIGPVWTDLTFKDPTYLLPLALGITMIITQRSQPQMMDAAQARIMTWVMPIFFTGIMINYPAGLALYIFTNNLLSIAQQAALKKFFFKKPPEVSGVTK